MLISSAIFSRTFAVGVGFLLNSSSRVVSWSCVARCRFWFFCCCVRVLFRGGRREAEFGALDPEADGEGDWLNLTSLGEVEEMGVVMISVGSADRGAMPPVISSLIVFMVAIM